jgi:hypothetical protein
LASEESRSCTFAAGDSSGESNTHGARRRKTQREFKRFVRNFRSASKSKQNS